MKAKPKKIKSVRDKFIGDVVAVFGKECGCHIQHRGCPCNSCFHALEDEIDWKHVSWILLLALRGDYDRCKDLVTSLKKELRTEVEE